MISIPNSPTIFLAERFANAQSPRLQEAVTLSPLESVPPTTAVSARLAEEITIHPFLAWSTALPLLLWAGQEEAKGDTGGTLVFMVCCAIAIGIFSKTGWRNEQPK